MNFEPSSKKWLSLALSMKYITNATILAAVIGYYTQAYWIFLVSIPLLITNAIVISLVEWFNADELVAGVLDIPASHREVIEANKPRFIFLNTVWYILGRDNLIEIFRPNFMGAFLAGAVFAISYFYFASQGKYYGEIDYTRYMIVYIIILLVSSICVFS